MRDGTQQRLATLCVCATWHRVDAGAQDRCKGTHRPIVVPTCEGRDDAKAAVLQRVDFFFFSLGKIGFFELTVSVGLWGY